METNNKLTKKEIFYAISDLLDECDHIELAMNQLQSVKSEGLEDIGAQAKANAIAKIVEIRETTLQKTLALYEKMYDDIQNEKDMMSAE